MNYKFIFLFLLLFSCDKMLEEKYFVEGTIENIGSFTFTDDPNGKYKSIVNTTIIQAEDASTGRYWNLIFKGNSTGNYPNSTIQLIISFSEDTYYAGTGEINVTKYESVDGIIEGNFYAENAVYVKNGITNSTGLRIKDGRFKVRREE